MSTEHATLETKLTQLKITVHRTKSVLQSGRPETIKRHLEALRATLQEADECKRAVEVVKISDKEELSKINEWNDDIDARLAEADGEINRIENWLSDKRQEEVMVAQEDQLKFEVKLHETRLKLQMELQNGKPENQTTTSEPSTRMAKLPKLVISKFDGSYMDWPRFWGQFSEAIDKSSIAPISKFTYLCELLTSKVKRTVEALPYTSEGYNRAKAILKDRYGKDSEIVKAYVKEIMDLPYITSANPAKIHEFSEKLSTCVQALETMKKLDQVNGNVSMAMDKLPGIRGDLVRTDPDWETWDFVKLSEALQQWTRRNPVDKRATEKGREEVNQKRDRPHKLFQAQNREFKPRGCVYCGDVGHKATECEKITNVVERKQVLAKKGLCFNCATRVHRASECKSKTSCQHCNRRHHSSICDAVCEQLPKPEENSGNDEKTKRLLTDGGRDCDGIFPVVVVEVEGITCRPLIDSGAGSSYASAKLIDMLKTKPSETRTQRIDMLMSSRIERMEVYDTAIGSVDGSFKMQVRLTKINKGELLSIDNPNYERLIKEHEYLKGVEVTDHDAKQKLPIHLLLGSGEYARIKTKERPLVGKDGDPVAEKTNRPSYHESWKRV